MGRVAAVVRWAIRQAGRPYRWGQAGPAAYDCSGLVVAAYAHAGLHLPHQSGALLRYGQPVSRAELAPGDLVFPNGHHVAIYLGHGMIVEAANPAVGVRVTRMWGFWTARRLL